MTNAARVMIVEDERITALNLQQRLIRLGYEVPAMAASGQAALSKVNEMSPDLVLMDIHIEGDMDGIETAARIRASHNIPVVYLTAYSEDGTLERARATQPYGYLLKPFSERELHATIQMALERHAAEDAVEQSETRMRLALDAANMGTWELDPDTHSMQRSPRADQIFGLTSETFSGNFETLIEGVCTDDRERVSNALAEALHENKLFQAEFRAAPDGVITRSLMAQGKVFTALGHGARRMIGVVQDITERRATEDRLRQAATVLESLSEGVFVADAGQRVISINHAFTVITGLSADNILGRRVGEIIHEQTGNRMEDVFDEVTAKDHWRGEYANQRLDGGMITGWLSANAVHDEHGALTHFVGVISDISALRAAEAKLAHLAHHDALTGLPNRLLFLDRLERALSRARRAQSNLAVLFIDLDHFKRVNDTYGHEVGDHLLCGAVQRFKSVLRDIDTLARLGGDEFVIVMECKQPKADVTQVSERLLAAMKEPIVVAGRETRTSISIGAAVYPFDGQTREDLVRAADTAMYAAKERGRRTYAFYTPEMAQRFSRYAEAERELRRAINANELVLFYQPQVELPSARLIGAEALIRWRHPRRGLLGPGDIIPVAEESGLIDEVGSWVIHSAVRQASLWRKAGLSMRVSVNVSPLQLRKGRVPAIIAEALRCEGLDPSWLEVEITESALQDEEVTVASLRELKRMGVSITIDDFGTGYSCLSSLKHLPISRCKIDRAFVRDIPNDPNDAAIASAIIAMARHLDLKVLAEGIDKPEQVTFFNNLHCDAAQGFLFGRPMPALELANHCQLTSLTALHAKGS